MRSRLITRFERKTNFVRSTALRLRRNRIFRREDLVANFVLSFRQLLYRSSIYCSYVGQNGKRSVRFIQIRRIHPVTEVSYLNEVALIVFNHDPMSHFRPISHISMPPPNVFTSLAEAGPVARNDSWRSPAPAFCPRWA